LATVNEDSTSATTSIVEDVRKAKALDPSVTPSGYDQNLGKLISIIASVNVDEALDFLERTGKTNVPSATPYFLMAKLLNEKQRYSDALAKIKIAISINADIPVLYDERYKSEEALCIRRDSKTNACVNRAELVLRQARAYRGVGDSLVRLGQIGAALDIYSNSLRLIDALGPEAGSDEIQHSIAETLSTIGVLLEEEGGPKKAIDYLKSEFDNMKTIQVNVNREIDRLSIHES